MSRAIMFIHHIILILNQYLQYIMLGVFMSLSFVVVDGAQWHTVQNLGQLGNATTSIANFVWCRHGMCNLHHGQWFMVCAVWEIWKWPILVGPFKFEGFYLSHSLLKKPLKVSSFLHQSSVCFRAREDLVSPSHFLLLSSCAAPSPSTSSVLKFFCHPFLFYLSLPSVLFSSIF